MTFLFLLLVVAAMPYLSYISFQNIQVLEQTEQSVHLSRRSVYLQSIIIQLAICLFGFFVVRNESLTVQLGTKLNTTSILTASFFLMIALLIAGWSNRTNKQQEKNTLRHILPENKTDRFYWMAAVLIAAFCEEYIYRGVLYQLLYTQTGGSAIIASILCAIVFGFGHGTQGQKAILQIIPFALGFHLIVFVSKGLLLAMIVHFIYNVSVELFFGKKIRNSHEEH